MGSSRLPTEWVPEVARRQAGLFTRRQALAAGATEGQVRARRASGRWITVAGDALAPGHVVVGTWLRCQAAALTWPDAVVCLSTAAALHGFPVQAPRDVHVVVGHHRASRGGLRTHQLLLDRAEVTRVGMALVTTRERTLFDCLGRLPEPEASGLLAWAVTRDVLSAADLQQAVARRPDRWGNRQRRQAVQDASSGALSTAERRMHHVLRRSRITGWHGDGRILDARGKVVARVDVLFEQERLVLEVDGFAFHGHDRFQEDRTRQNALVALGYTVLRFTWSDLTERPRAVARQVEQTLALLRTRPA